MLVDDMPETGGQPGERAGHMYWLADKFATVDEMSTAAVTSARTADIKGQ